MSLSDRTSSSENVSNGSTVLARKWRPRTFDALIGQPHVVEALTHALERRRLHHAYLFAGTRGVGKTTLGRIFARALNCEKGITPAPCGECAVCRAIDEGRFVDLVEIDAASRTRVEDTREILDNVQYAPVQGRFKIYLIDEVHMLSASSFNALLKTLEEPPAHVKFILATTDPHKLPITVLSRCLKFNLLRVQPAQIVDHLAKIAQAESVCVEPDALRLIAYYADGSVRDALSLLDQAIAQSGECIAPDTVRRMLGLVLPDQLEALLTALAQDSTEALAQALTDLARQSVDYEMLLEHLLQQFHLIAMMQTLGRAAPDQDVSLAQAFVQRFSPERVQLCYQIGLQGQQDMQWAPDARTAFEMTLLRMLAFEPIVDEAETMRLPAASGGMRSEDGSGARPAATSARESGMSATSEDAVAAMECRQTRGEAARHETAPAVADAVDATPLVEHVCQDAPDRQLEGEAKRSLFAQLRAQLAAGGEEEGVAADAEAGKPQASTARTHAETVAREASAYDRQPISSSSGRVEAEPAHAPAASSDETVAQPEGEDGASGIEWLAPDAWAALVKPLRLEGVLWELAQDSAAGWQGPDRLAVAVHPEKAVLLDQREPAFLAALASLAQSVVRVPWPENAPLETLRQRREREDAVRRQAARERFLQDGVVRRICDMFDARPIESSIIWQTEGE